jgi:hypothetical protein
MRAVDGIQREATARFIPLAALAVPGNKAELLRYLHERRRVELEPHPDASDNSIGVLHWFRRLEWQIHEEAGENVGIGLQELSAPPVPSSSAVRAYCPKCREQYVRQTGVCADCPGVKLVLTHK